MGKREWIPVAAGDDGLCISPLCGFEALDRANKLLSTLEAEEGEGTSLIFVANTSSYFEGLKVLSNSPPFHRAADFEVLPGVSVEIDNLAGDSMPGMGFDFVQVFVQREQKQTLIREFEELIRRLKEYLLPISGDDS